MTAAAEARAAGRRPRSRPGAMKWAEASITSTPMPRKRAAESFGAMRAMAPWTCARTPAQSISGGGRRMPKRAGAARLGRGVGGGEQRLRGHAAVVQAVAAHPAALDQRDLQPEPGGDGGHREPGRAGADHHHVEVRHA